MASPVQQPSNPVSLVTDRLLVDNSVLKNNVCVGDCGEVTCPRL